MEYKEIKPASRSGAHCTTCGTHEGRISWCAGCMSVHYCSTACQKKDWKRHRDECKKGKKLLEQTSAGPGVCSFPVLRSWIKNRSIMLSLLGLLCLDYNNLSEDKILEVYLVYNASKSHCFEIVERLCKIRKFGELGPEERTIVLEQRRFASQAQSSGNVVYCQFTCPPISEFCWFGSPKEIIGTMFADKKFSIPNLIKFINTGSCTLEEYFWAPK